MWKVVEKSIHDKHRIIFKEMDYCIFTTQALELIIPQIHGLSQLTGMILKVVENGKHAGMILINHQKAFDTFDHKILIHKMKCSGFSDKTIKWFHSYLTELFRFIRRVFGSKRNRLQSSSRNCIGTFIVFAVYDIPQAWSGGHIYLYADDTSIFHQQKDLGEIKNF